MFNCFWTIFSLGAPECIWLSGRWAPLPLLRFKTLCRLWVVFLRIPGKQITMNIEFYNLQKKQVQYLRLYSTETYTSRYRNCKSNIEY